MHIYISPILINGIRIMHQSFEMKGFVNQEEIKQLQRTAVRGKHANKKHNFVYACKHYFLTPEAD